MILRVIKVFTYYLFCVSFFIFFLFSLVVIVMQIFSGTHNVSLEFNKTEITPNANIMPNPSVTNSKLEVSLEENYVHNQFANNSGTCRSCHVTGQAAGDISFNPNKIYTTCTACHDGTYGKLNVFNVPLYDPTIQAAKFANVGGGSFTGFINFAAGASMHFPNGYLIISAAPGGNRAFNADLNGDEIMDVEAGVWGGDFTCGSCHQPHGSYSDRLLASNPANIGRQAVTIADWRIIGTDPSGKKLWGAVYNGRVIKGPWVLGIQYGAGFTQTVIFNERYKIDTSVTPMLVDPAKKRGEKGYILTQEYHLNNKFNMDYEKGTATKKSEENLPPGLKIAIVPAVVVKVAKGVFSGDGDLVPVGPYHVDKTNEQPYLQGLDGSIIRWRGSDNTLNRGKNGITWFCSACHTDYYAEQFIHNYKIDLDYDGQADGTTNNLGHPNIMIDQDGMPIQGGLEGKYSYAYRHTINLPALDNATSPNEQLFVDETVMKSGREQNVVTCLSCHYAHGTTRQLMRNADDTPATFPDVNPSSALKRYVNMSVCLKCHG